MITELEREKQNRSKIDNGIRLCEEAIARAEKYERLMENKDFKEYLDDLKRISGMHETEIKNAVLMLEDAPAQSHVKMDETGRQTVVSSREDWANFIANHQIKKTYVDSWIKEPEHIISLARLAREKLPVLKEKLAEMGDAGKPMES